jgi:hypothetical protein
MWSAARCNVKHLTKIVVCFTALPGDAKVQAIQRMPAGSSFDEVFIADLTISDLARVGPPVASGAGEESAIRRGRAGSPDHGTVEPAKAGATKRRSMDR